jgi:anthranilate/para-aminobenzoate synthase component I
MGPHRKDTSTTWNPRIRQVKFLILSLQQCLRLLNLVRKKESPKRPIRQNKSLHFYMVVSSWRTVNQSKWKKITKNVKKILWSTDSNVMTILVKKQPSLINYQMCMYLLVSLTIVLTYIIKGRANDDLPFPHQIQYIYSWVIFIDHWTEHDHLCFTKQHDFYIGMLFLKWEQCRCQKQRMFWAGYSRKWIILYRV